MTRKNSLFVDEQLFTELTPTAGAAIIGGATLYLSSNLNRPITFGIRPFPASKFQSYRYDSLNPSQKTKTYTFPGYDRVQVLFDERTQVITLDHIWTFSTDGTNVVLSRINSVAARGG